jgi:hypothetical protein
MIYGSGFTTYYGMPFVKVYDYNNRVIGYRQAEEVAYDGSWIRVPCPDMAQSYSGNYTLVISLGIGPNTYQEYAEASMTGYGRDAIDVDGDGFPNDVDCNDNDPNVNPLAAPDCSGSYYDRNCNDIYDYDECYPGGGGGGGCNTYSSMPQPMDCY